MDEGSALGLSAFWCAVRVLSETPASLPLVLYRRLKNGDKERADDHYLYGVLHDAFNPEMTAITGRECGQGHVLSWGNVFLEIERDNGGRVKHLWPLLPNRVRVDRNKNGRIVYRVRRRRDAVEDILDMEDVFHVPGLGFDGVVGYSVVSVARESIGLGLATERFGAGWFGNGARPGGILKHPGRLKQQARGNLADAWDKVHRGPDNGSRVAVLEEGMDWKQIGIPPEDSQFLQTRQFQVSEIARWFNIPPHMLRDLTRSTNNNIEDQGRSFVIYTMRYWLVKWEQEIVRKLLTRRERTSLFAEHDVDSLMRGDRESRNRAYATARQWGWMSANDVLREENKNTIGPQGDIYLSPGNMNPAGVGATSTDKEPDDEIEDRPGEVADDSESDPNEKPRDGALAAPEAPASLPSPPPIDALRPLLLEHAGRWMRREAQAARRAAKTPSKFLSWIDTFYVRHLADLEAAWQPAAEACATLKGGPDNYGALVGRVVGCYVRESRHALLEAAGNATAANLEAGINALCDQWEKDRPAQLVEAVMNLKQETPT